MKIISEQSISWFVNESQSFVVNDKSSHPCTIKAPSNNEY